MKTKTVCKRFLICVAVILLTFQFENADAQSKKNFIKRAYINTVSRYNYYYNAGEKVKQANLMAVQANIDEFNEVVRLFPYSNEASLKGNIPEMDEAIKKCNHIITRRQSSKWVDDSWLMIGKANFFKGDFFAAKETFEYVATNYKKNPKVSYEAEIWLVKTSIMLGKFDEAVALSEILIADKKFPKNLKKELYLVNAEGLAQQGKYVEAYSRLKVVLPKVKKKEYRYRRYFVAGQLALLNNNSEEAIKNFKKVISSNTPYDFDFYSRINMVNLYTRAPINDVEKGRGILKKMLKDDKNLDLLDQIYYELGMIDYNHGDRKSALEHFRNSLANSKVNKTLKSRVYLLAAELYFENRSYENAQKYYDSAVQVLSPDADNYKQISERHQVLTDLITNLINISYQDSMLRLSRDADYRKETLQKIKEDERKRVEEEERRKNDPFANPQNDPFAGMSGSINNQQSMAVDSRFPFYNIQLKRKGEGDFTRVWGNRELGDYWRIETIARSERNMKEDSVDDDDSDDELTETKIPDKLPDDISSDDEKYFASVPFGKDAQKEAEYSMGESYFLAGEIYRNRLNEDEEARKLLETFVVKLRGNSYIENALYLLIKIFDDRGDKIKSEKYFAMLKEGFPESNFIKILEDPEEFKKNIIGTSEDEKLATEYENFYDLYKSQNFKKALTVYDSVQVKYPANKMEAQFDFVYALIKIEQKKGDEYLKIMQDIAGNYSGTPIGDLAQDRVNAYLKHTGQYNPDENDQTQSGKVYPYIKGNEKGDWYFIVKINDNMDMNMSKIAFSDFNKSFRSNKVLSITTSFVDVKTKVLVVTGFESMKEAKEYVKDVALNKELHAKIKADSDPNSFMYITKDNFSTLIAEKNFELYKEFFVNTYL